MAFEHYIRNGQKWLRCGYTTGTCSALGAAGATRLLLTGQAPDQVELMTPKGLMVEAPLLEPHLIEGGACAAICKDGGDDADVTHGHLVVASVYKRDAPGVEIDGGLGVGRVTKPGLDQPVGNAAINHVPRQMIAAAVQAECDRAGYNGGIMVVISVPDGEELAKKTFNPVLGIQGGISILGTSGIVEPMSLQAIVDTIGVEIKAARATGSKNLLLTPGNYGMDFLKANGLDVPGVPLVKYSNFIGEALDMAAAEGFEQVLLVGHIGKLVKVAGGIMNTHSRWADCRLEIFTAYAALAGASHDTLQKLMTAATTDAAIHLLDEAGLREPIMAEIIKAIQLHLERRAAGSFHIGAMVFSNEYGLLGQTDTVEEIMNIWRQ